MIFGHKRVNKVCECCDGIYSVVPSIAATRKYCSIECASAMRINFDYKVSKCKHCKKSFRHKVNKQRMYCGVKCSTIANGKKRSQDHANRTKAKNNKRSV